MMLRRPIAACAASTPLSAALKSRAFSTFRPRTTTAFKSATPFAAFRLSKPFNITTQLRKASFDTRPSLTDGIQPSGSNLVKLLTAAGLFGGTILATNFLFNRETREGGIPTYEREYLHESFVYTGLGVGMIGLAAKGLHNMGWSYKLMAVNPWVFMGISLVGGIGTMYATMATDPENYIQKYTLWSAFNLCQAATLSPVFFMHPALVARAGLYTVGLMGAISYVGATAKTDQYLWLGGPLLGGLAVVIMASLAPMIMPRMIGARGLAMSENISLYGGLAVFGGMTLWDTQKILYNARLSERGLKKRDTVNESISLELDFINIFIRMIAILGRGDSKRR